MLSKTQAKKRERSLRGRLDHAGVTYQRVADEAHVSWTFVYMVIHGLRESARVLAAIDRLCDGKDTPVN